MTLKNRKSKKLQLSRETVRVLGRDEMESVAGGWDPAPTLDPNKCYNTQMQEQQGLG